MSVFDQNFLEFKIEPRYARLLHSAAKIIKAAQEETDSKNIYDPKKHSLVETENREEFKEYQTRIRNLNNYIYYNSLLLVSYSIFEHCLEDVCLFIDEKNLSQELYKKPERDILKENYMYLLGKTGLIELPDPELDRCYNEISDANKLRNLIAHHNGNLIKDKDRALEKQVNYKVFNKNKSLSICKNGQIYINNPAYILDFIHIFHKFLYIIIEKIKIKMNSEN